MEMDSHARQIYEYQEQTMKFIIKIEDDYRDCQPFTIDRPVALLRVLDKAILEYQIEALSECASQILICAGKWQHAVRDLLGERYSQLPIAYVESGLPVDGIQIPGELIYGATEAAALAAGASVLEIGATALRYPWNLLEANVAQLAKLRDCRRGEVEEGVFIKGPVHIAEGALIKSGSYIEGPVYIGRNTRIGPFAHIRPDSVIESDCEIGKAELYDCLIMRGTTCKHQAYVGHSVIGENVNIGAGLITADYRHDAGLHSTVVDGRKVATGRSKLGAFIGAGVHTGIGTLIYPGRKIWPGLGTLPGEIVSKDKS
jgi:NDP-sugar pyrophosphorylase family protein